MIFSEIVQFLLAKMSSVGYHLEGSKFVLCLNYHDKMMCSRSGSKPPPILIGNNRCVLGVWFVTQQFYRWRNGPLCLVGSQIRSPFLGEEKNNLLGLLGIELLFLSCPACSQVTMSSQRSRP